MNIITIVVYAFILGFFLCLMIPFILTMIVKKEFSEKVPIIIRFINRLVLDKITLKHKKIYGFTLFCGHQGGGKTYSAVKYCYEIAKANKSLLVSNTPLNVPPEIRYLYLNDISDFRYLPDSDSLSDTLSNTCAVPTSFILRLRNWQKIL